MADNYLEKKMEQHKARACVGGAAKGKNTILSLLDRCTSSLEFDDYVVREDQLRRIVVAATKVTSAFSYECFTAPLPAELCILQASACIVVGAPEAECDLLLLGRVVQVMALQAAEMGLCARCAGTFDSVFLKKTQPFPVVLIVVGRVRL